MPDFAQAENLAIGRTKAVLGMGIAAEHFLA